MATDVRGGLVERPVDPEKPREQQKAEKRYNFTLSILARTLFPRAAIYLLKWRSKPVENKGQSERVSVSAANKMGNSVSGDVEKVARRTSVC